MNGIEEYLQRDWHMILGREHGPLAFRFVLQPLVAGLLAVRAGLQDARDRRRPFGWALASERSERRKLIREGWAHVGRLYIIAVLIDVIYQVIVFRTVYPGQSLLVAAVLAFPTYVIARGLTNRVAQQFGYAGGGTQGGDGRRER